MPKKKPRRARDRLGRLLPKGIRSVPADPSQQVPNNSYSPPPTAYYDLPFTCVDCGKDEVWTAEQQQWWYEVAKGSLYTTAIRCRACRQAQRERGGP
jgi:hypothetical protein